MAISATDASEHDGHPSVTFDRVYATLLLDGAHLLRASERSTDVELSNSFARGSLACTMMMPEVVANVLIETLALEAATFSDVDRMSASGKFDFYLRTRFRNKKLDRGSLPVQKLQELKRLRDIFVHPRPQRVRWTPVDDLTHSGESETSPLLGMSKNPAMWFSDDAIFAMRAVHEFFAFFFQELCQLPKRQVSALLFSQDAVPDARSYTYQLFDGEVVNSLKRWKVNISYFRY